MEDVRTEISSRQRHIEETAVQRKWLEEARLLLKPGKVKPHEIPPWLGKRLRGHRKELGLSRMYSGSLLLVKAVEATSGYARWLDHWGTSDVGAYSCCKTAKSKLFVSEPYDLNESEIKALSSFCWNMGDLVWHVSSNTYWFPGRTVRVTIHEKDTVEP